MVVGGINTLVGLASFWLLFHYFGATLHYMGALVGAYAIAIMGAFLLHRRFVFKVRGQFFVDLVRFTLVQLGALGLNALLLPLFVEGVGVPVIPAQVLSLVLVVMGSYVGHLAFSFRRGPS